MLKKCKHKPCSKDFEGRSNKLFCSPRCKKNFENSLRTGPMRDKKKRALKMPSGDVNRPQWLNEIAAGYWDKVAPTVQERGHLNILSEDAFAELCDIYSRLVDVNKAIDETNRSLLQIIEQWDNKNGVENQQFKESALSDLKRKYSRLLLDYQKQFYLTPLSNRGNFGIEDNGSKEDEKTGTERFF